jgi:DNA gyrase inhibitor GyrI
MIFRVIGFLLVLTLILLGVGILLPAEVKLQRDTTVAAPPEAVFMRVNSLREFQTWSPWAAKDPDMKVAYTGAETGAGAKMSWTSAVHGSGSQEIKDATFPKTVLYRMELGGSDVVFAQITLTPAPNNATKVEWSYQTDLGGNPLKRYAGLFYSSWVSADYDAGLARLKASFDGGTPIAAAPRAEDLDTSKLPPAVEQALTDKEPQPSPIPTPAQVAADPDIVVLEPRPIVFVSTKAKAGDQAAISAALGNANTALFDYVARHSLEVSGSPLAISEQHDPAGERKFDASIPLSSVPAGLPEEGKVELGKTPGGKVMTMVHKGPYSTIDDTYAKLRAKIKDKGLKEGRYNWEEYVTDSSEVDEAELLTNVYIQVE